MGIQSTQNISREDAISRVKKISYLVKSRMFVDLDSEVFDPVYELAHAAEIIAERTERMGMSDWDTNTENYSNGMLGDLMDVPFIRKSMFDNYIVADEYED